MGRRPSHEGSRRTSSEPLGAHSGHPRKHAPPALGARYGDLTVTGYFVGVRGGLVAVEVACSCGNVGPVSQYSLRSGRSTRCNTCAPKASAEVRKKYFGYADIVPDVHHRERLLGRIGAAINRCENPNDAGYAGYGGRGIRVCEAWRNSIAGRRAFLEYLVSLNGWDDATLELDRIDNERGYEPENLRFVPRWENMLNKRKTHVMQAEIQRLREENARLRSGGVRST